MKSKIFNIIFFIASASIIVGCKDESSYGPDPYAGGKEAYGIRFEDTTPSPSQGKAGTAMTFRVSGLSQYKDEVEFLINNAAAQITSITDSTITAVLPENVSTGGTSLVVKGQIFPGPMCYVIGKVAIDPTFRSGAGANGIIRTIKKLTNNNYFIGGSFTNYDGFAASTTINGIARITAGGEFVRGMNFRKSVEGGSVNSIHELSDGNLLISGSFVKYDTTSLVSNITKINTLGELQTEKVEILNLTSDPNKSSLTVPVFNGGTLSGITKTFVHNNKVTAIGGFGYFVDRYYERSTYNGILTEIFQMNSIVRMHMTGGLDSTFNIDHTSLPKKSKGGLVGIVEDGYMQNDGKLIVVGRFNRYNNASVAGNIIRLNEDGSVDQSFKTGSGADNSISSIVRSESTGKYIITGTFKTFNGVAASGLAVLNEDGTLDNTFSNKGFSGGYPNFCYPMSNGLIIVSGSFTKYNNINREGFLVLNADGSLAKDFNNTGKLYGTIYNAIEGINNLGQRSVTLVGYITSFNGQSNIGNIMRLTFQD